jgi:hypothetical protein
MRPKAWALLASRDVLPDGAQKLRYTHHLRGVVSDFRAFLNGAAHAHRPMMADGPNVKIATCRQVTR